MKGKNSKKSNKINRILVIRKRDMIICHILAIAGVLIMISSLLLPARLLWLIAVLLLCGALMTSFGFFARDFFLRCPSCGRTLMKDLPFKAKMKCSLPKGCPQCSWATKIEYTKK